MLVHNFHIIIMRLSGPKSMVLLRLPFTYYTLVFQLNILRAGIGTVNVKASLKDWRFRFGAQCLVSEFARPLENAQIFSPRIVRISHISFWHLLYAGDKGSNSTSKSLFAKIFAPFAVKPTPTFELVPSLVI